MSGETVHVLLVEDDEVDAEALIRAFQKHNIVNPLTIVPDGIEALNALKGDGAHERLPRPYLILLDLNLPRMNGIEFLRTLRQEPELKDSIVFVLTTSDRDQDVIAAYQEQVAGYILKSSGGKGLVDLIKLLDSYWRMVEFPPEPR